MLLSAGLATDDPSTTRDAATSMAHLLDGRLLGPMADASAFTGIMLAAATPWGFFRHWWVLAKFLITLVQLYLGIFLLSPALAGSLREGSATRCRCCRSFCSSSGWCADRGGRALGWRGPPFRSHAPPALDSDVSPAGCAVSWVRAPRYRAPRVWSGR